MFVIKYRWIFYIISILLVLAALASLYTYGLNLGTDFRGGAILEVEYASSTPALAEVKTALTPLDLGSVSVQPAGENGFILRSRNISEAEHQQVLAALPGAGQFSEKRFSTVGPALGQELARKALVAIVLVAALIIIYIAIAFRGLAPAGAARGVRGPGSWKYGVIAIIALVHDIAIPTGVFAWLGHYRGVEVDALFLTALLTILGLSVNDTIVVFDRVRESLRRKTNNATFAEIVGRSLEQTFTRSLNTSLSVIVALLALLFFGSESTRYFALALTIGMAVGTYSSIFLASPLLVSWAGVNAKK